VGSDRARYGRNWDDNHGALRRDERRGPDGHPQVLGEADTRRLLDLLRPITAAVIHSGLITRPNAVGIVWIEQDN
jgi:hypothetical protein